MKKQRTNRLRFLYRAKGKLNAALYLLPAAAIFSVFMVWPILYSLYLSALDWNMVSENKRFVGLQNYIEIFQDATFIKAIGNTAVYVLVLVALNFVLPYLLSYVLARLIRKGSQFYRSVMFFPSLLSGAVSAIVFMWLYNPAIGPFPALCDLLGVKTPVLLTTPVYVIVAISLITAWRCFGYNLIVFLASIVEVPIELIEAAKLEKVGNWKIFWNIVRPLTSSTALYVFIITFVFGLNYMFVPIKMLTQGGPNYASTNLIYIVYQYGFVFFRTGRAAAIAIVSLILFISIVVIQKRLEKKVHYEI